jgi:hypothetical protein
MHPFSGDAWRNPKCCTFIFFEKKTFIILWNEIIYISLHRY